MGASRINYDRMSNLHASILKWKAEAVAAAHLKSKYLKYTQHI